MTDKIKENGEGEGENAASKPCNEEPRLVCLAAFSGQVVVSFTDKWPGLSAVAVSRLGRLGLRVVSGTRLESFPVETVLQRK